MNHATHQDIKARLDYVSNSPKDNGTLKLIVSRPSKNERKILDSCKLTVGGGVEGDHWAKGCWKSLEDGAPHPDVQVSLMNYRILEIIGSTESQRALAGDNMCVDFDLSEENLKTGDQLKIGSVILEITDMSLYRKMTDVLC